MSAASFATDVPVLPIAMPTSARLSAGASFVPSPVTATTSSCALRQFTSLSLSFGRALAMTLMRLAATSASSSERAWNFAPVISASSSGAPSASRRLLWRAISLAVSGLSPVTILTVIPASRHSSSAPGTSGRTGSAIAANPSQRRSCATLWTSRESMSGSSRYANPRVRMPRSCQERTSFRISRRLSSVAGTSSPAVPRSVHFASRNSGAPLRKRTGFPASVSALPRVAMNLSSVVKGHWSSAVKWNVLRSAL